jgi:hypothetical protein
MGGQSANTEQRSRRMDKPNEQPVGNTVLPTGIAPKLPELVQ